MILFVQNIQEGYLAVHMQVLVVVWGICILREIIKLPKSLKTGSWLNANFSLMKSWFDGKFVVTGGNAEGDKDNLQCPQRRQNWRHDNSLLSVVRSPDSLGCNTSSDNLKQSA